MSRVDYSIYASFMGRWTDEEYARLREVEARNFLETCPFVERLRGNERGEEWFDPRPFVGEEVRGAAPNLEYELRPAGKNEPDNHRYWATASGEIA